MWGISPALGLLDRSAQGGETGKHDPRSLACISKSESPSTPGRASQEEVPESIVPGASGGCSGAWDAGFLEGLLPVRECPWGRSLGLNPPTLLGQMCGTGAPSLSPFQNLTPPRARSGCRACAGKCAGLVTAPGALVQATGGTSEWSHYAMTKRCKAEGTQQYPLSQPFPWTQLPHLFSVA